MKLDNRIKELIAVGEITSNLLIVIDKGCYGNSQRAKMKLHQGPVHGLRRWLEGEQFLTE